MPGPISGGYVVNIDCMLVQARILVIFISHNLGWNLTQKDVEPCFDDRWMDGFSNWIGPKQQIQGGKEPPLLMVVETFTSDDGLTPLCLLGLGCQSRKHCPPSKHYLSPFIRGYY